MPAYLGLYLSFPVLCPNYKQLAATTNRIGILTSSYGYLIMGLAQVLVRPLAVYIRVSS